jgi:HprK-related kinase B
MTQLSSFHGIAASLIEAPLTERLGLLFAGVRMDVASNSKRLIEQLAAYYREFLGDGGEPLITVNAIEREALSLDLPFALKEREPGKALKEEFVEFQDGRVVRKVRTGMVFMFGGGQHYAFGPCIENEAQVVNFINNRFIELRINQGGLLFHASGVALNDAGLALVGFAGAGKSTLALHIMRLGTDFISNDRLMVERSSQGLFMTGVPKMPRVNPGTILNNESLKAVITDGEREQFLKLPTSELWDLEHKYDAFIDECFGPGKFQLGCPMAGLAILNWKRTSEPLVVQEVDLSKRNDLFPTFMKSVGLFFEMDDPARGLDFSEEAYLELLNGCPVLEFTGGNDFDSAANECVSFLKSRGNL